MMNKPQARELAAILVSQYGRSALAFARQRRSQHAREPRSEAFRVWNSITLETARLLRSRARRLRSG